MELTINGFPKSGNHALAKAVQLLGIPCEVDHIEYGNAVNNKHIFIKRDPRNIVCSWIRFIGKPVTDGMFITALRKFQAEDFFTEIGKFTGWLNDENTLVIKYEDLVANDIEIKRISEYLNIPFLDSAFKNLPSDTKTWCSVHSDYRDIWNEHTERVWTEIGGEIILTNWGY